MTRLEYEFFRENNPELMLDPYWSFGTDFQERIRKHNEATLRAERTAQLLMASEEGLARIKNYGWRE